MERIGVNVPPALRRSRQVAAGPGGAEPDAPGRRRRQLRRMGVTPSGLRRHLGGISREEIYRCHAADLTRFAASLVGTAHAQDVVADAVVRAMWSRAWPSVRNHRAYLYRAVMNEAKMHHRAFARRTARERRVAVPERHVDPDVRPDRLGDLPAGRPRRPHRPGHPGGGRPGQHRPQRLRGGDRRGRAVDRRHGHQLGGPVQPRRRALLAGHPGRRHGAGARRRHRRDAAHRRPRGARHRPRPDPRRRLGRHGEREHRGPHRRGDPARPP